MARAFTRDSRWLFIGDSITDCDRRTCPESLGSGYVRFIRDWLLSLAPAFAPEILNRGISGNKITDLQGRWAEDVLAHKPQLVSVKIGINDVWHGLNPGGQGTSIEDFRAGYEEILASLKTAHPEVTLVLCEPSVIWSPSNEAGNALLLPYIDVVRDMGKKFGAAAVVPLHDIFEKARTERPDVAWAPDGVHPSSSGHTLIARSWLAALGLL